MNQIRWCPGLMMALLRSQIDVLCHTERGNISIGDEVIVEGKILRNMIYAFAIQVQK
ncbi:MAG: hypothetical protein OCU17_00380 [Methanophagales archaeon]|nr:hypothetical protein [Methanophagales archaeon]